jgi:diadenosine tetraphosphate (Ap4A) HIT family hydrolase
MECPFCQSTILKKESFYEDDFFRAIYNLRPVVKGHCLVIPKRHIEELYQLKENERKDFISFSNKAIFIAEKYSETNEFDFLLQKGENAGQSIKHLHFHIIPRKKNDILKVAKKEFLQTFQKEENSDKVVSEQEMTKIVSELKSIAEKHRLQINEL